MTRRSFLAFSAAMAAALALPVTYAPRIARAVEAAPRLPVIWLRGTGCGGDTAALLRATQPTIGALLLETLSVDYHESLMAAAGATALDSAAATMRLFPHGYIAVIEGAVPTADGGAACIVGGRPFADVARQVSAGALATIAVGSCAVDGGAPAATGGTTDAHGASQVAQGTLVSLPGCPVNVENLTATVVHYLTFGDWPATDAMHRPYFAYGSLIHNQCERRPYFEFGQFVQDWGDEGAQKGWCLYKMGCKGPETNANCPTVQYASRTSWPVRAGHGCIGCTMPGFWDSMAPAYDRLPSPLPIGPQLSVDQVGLLLTGAVAAGTVMHGAASYVRQKRVGDHEAVAVASASIAALAHASGAAVPVDLVEPAGPVDTEPVISPAHEPPAHETPGPEPEREP